MASILNYFPKKPKKPSEALRDTTVGEEELQDINPVIREEVCKQLNIAESSSSSGRSKYRKYTNLERADIGSYAAAHGVAKAVRKFEEKFPGISRQTVSDFKRNFNKRKVQMMM